MSFESPEKHDAGAAKTVPAEEPRLLTRRDRDEAEPPVQPAPKTEKPPREPRTNFRVHRVVRRIAIGIGVLAALCIVVLLLTTLWLRHAMHTSLPQLDGTLQVHGLSAPVTVTRDAQGVPSVHAQTLDDVLFAQGYVTAQDRLFQMDALRRHAAGELAEVLGPALVEHDKLQRYLQLRAAADHAVTIMRPEQLHQLTAYANGVNAFIEQHRDSLPVEFHLLHYQPAPWTPRDSVLASMAMWQDLSTEFPNKLRREALSAHLSPELLADLYPVGSWRDHPPTQPAPNLTTPHDVEEIPLDASQYASNESATPQDLMRYTPTSCDGCKPGSNNWVVAGTKSASGAPLLSNDMHLGLNAPDIWYEAALHTADATALDVTGFTLPGVPYVLVGRNAHVAWGFTAMLGDVQDVRIEHLRGSGEHEEFERPDGSWTPVEHRAEQIHVRGGRDLHLDVVCTSMTVGNNTIATPIISPLYPSEHRALSLAWTLYDSVGINDPYLAVNTAQDGASLVASFATLGGPSLNLVYADAQHIGYHAVGRIPIRGPAIHHPRSVELPVVPQGDAPKDEEDESKQPQASLSRPHLVLASYQRRRPERREKPEPRKRATAPKKPSTAKLVPAKPAPEVKPEVLAPTPAVMDYTIGSPISPVPVDALDANQVWSGYIPFNEMPSIVDPPGGIIATANSRITPDDYPYAIANDWVDPYRAERAYQMLAGHTGLKPADMLAVQMNVHSNFDLLLAQKLAYAVDHASADVARGDAKRLHQAADLLRRWNGDMAADSPAAAIITSTRATLLTMLLTAQIREHDHSNNKAAAELVPLYTWEERNTALELLLAHTPARWVPPGIRGWDDMLAGAMVAGLHEAHAPADLTRWSYGAIHPVEIAHPVFGSHSFLSRLLGVATGSGLHPTGGDSTTLRAVGLHFGPSERFTADMSDAEATIANITTGESGNPASSWYLDQFLPWLKGTTFALPLMHSSAQHTLTLTP